LSACKEQKEAIHAVCAVCPARNLRRWP
jgi:hypothetical protein